MMGPGKYDDLCTIARKATRCRGVLLIVIDGKDGSGFSCQADLETTLRIPQLLREMADKIERDADGLKQ